MEHRVTELEIKLAFTEDLVEELNRTVYRQQQAIETLQRAVQELRLQIASAQPGEGSATQHEVPPHY